MAKKNQSFIITEDDITEILEYKPEVLIIGTGASGLMKFDDNLKEKLKALRIEFVIKKNR